MYVFYFNSEFTNISLVMFKIFDYDNSGSIEVSEFRRVLRILLPLVDPALTVNEQLLMSKVNSVLRTVDVNKDGEVSLQEFHSQFQKSPYLCQALIFLFGKMKEPNETPLPYNLKYHYNFGQL